MFLLDTNVISELRKTRPHGGVVAWINATPQVLLHISAVTIMELQDGALATRKQNTQKADEIEAWIDELQETFEIIPLDGKAARLTARMMQGTSVNLFEDAMIAAIAKVHALTVVTRNVKDFERFHVPLENPFLYKG